METLFFKPATIKEFLKANKAKLDQYDELVIGLALSNFHRAQGIKETVIGFKVTPELFRILPQKGKTNLTVIGLIINYYKDTYTPIDIVIAFDSIASLGSRTNNGIAYQLKRFRKNSDGDGALALIHYLNQIIPKKYSKTDAKLILLPEKIRTIDWPHITNQLKTEGFPFNSIMFFVVSEGKICIGELWPQAGMNKYTVAEILA